MRFQPGRSGNPSGLSSAMSKSIREIRQKAVDAAGAAFDVMVKAGVDGVQLEKGQLDAIRQILDRALGKAHQSIDISHGPEISEDEIPRLTSQQIGMLFDNKGHQFIESLFDNGTLEHYYLMLKSGNRLSNCDSIPVLKAPLSIEQKVDGKVKK